jgi:hypothetical protein
MHGASADGVPTASRSRAGAVGWAEHVSTEKDTTVRTAAPADQDGTPDDIVEVVKASSRAAKEAFAAAVRVTGPKER